jgi:hypothetical protein
MTFPQRGMDIIDALYRGVDPQDDDARRVAIQRVGEQMSFDLGPEWGNKKRTGLSDDFRSADSVAFQEADLTVSVWDIQASSGAILVAAGKPPDYPHLPSDEAEFIQCAPINHLGGPDPDPAPVPDDPELSARVSVLERELARQREVNALVTQVLQEHQVAMEALLAELEKPLHVSGQTGRSFAHSHSFSAEVTRG